MNKFKNVMLVVVSMLIGALMVSGINTYATEKENEDKFEITEKEIYGQTEYDYIVPMKAIDVPGEEDIQILTDLQGWFQVTNGFELESGENYITWFAKETGELMHWQTNDFEFTYQHTFEDEEYMQEEIDLVMKDYYESKR